MKIQGLLKHEWITLVRMLRGEDAAPMEWRLDAAARIDSQVRKRELYAERRASGNLRGRPLGARSGE